MSIYGSCASAVDQHLRHLRNLLNKTTHFRGELPELVGAGSFLFSYARYVQGAVTVHLDAPAERVWELVSDVTRIGEFSPETFEAEWLDGADGRGPGRGSGACAAQRDGAGVLDDVHGAGGRPGA